MCLFFAYFFRFIATFSLFANGITERASFASIEGRKGGCTCFCHYFYFLLLSGSSFAYGSNIRANMHSPVYIT